MLTLTKCSDNSSTEEAEFSPCKIKITKRSATLIAKLLMLGPDHRERDMYHLPQGMALATLAEVVVRLSRPSQVDLLLEDMQAMDPLSDSLINHPINIDR